MRSVANLTLSTLNLTGMILLRCAHHRDLVMLSCRHSHEWYFFLLWLVTPAYECAGKLFRA